MLQYIKPIGPNSRPVSNVLIAHVCPAKLEGLPVCIVCVRHATHDSPCIIQSCGTHACYFNWEIGISSIINSDLHVNYRCLMKR